GSRREVLRGEGGLERREVFDRVRFVSSGTEAVMSAIRLARGATGRDLILKFEGCYHGHADHLLVDAGSGLATFGTPSSEGVPADFSRHTAVLPLGDEARLRAFFDEHGDELAALIIEPVPANAGLLVQTREFLQLCRDLTAEHGSLLIFDEVITGFRVARGGARELFGITPDIGTYGKIIGGGMPVGAYASSAKIMRHVSPDGPVYQAGTLSGNPVAMAAGLAVLEKIGRPGFYDDLERKTDRLADGLRAAAAESGVTDSVVRVGSLFWMVFQDPAPTRFDQVDGDMSRYGTLHRGLLERGVYLAPSGWEVGFVSAAHTNEDIDRTATIVAEVLGDL
ncbi:glutamate-1-semialdehyde 2,1-aminomutase, partial [bacterium]|nr:glutamate-1-semialdehyde 2,1-aminomutase [bacterium]